MTRVEGPSMVRELSSCAFCGWTYRSCSFCVQDRLETLVGHCTADAGWVRRRWSDLNLVLGRGGSHA